MKILTENRCTGLHPISGLDIGPTICCRRILGQGNFFLKQNPSEANLTLDDLKQMLHSNSYDSFMSKLMQYTKNVTGINACWNKARTKQARTWKQSFSRRKHQQYFGHCHVLIFIGLSFINSLPQINWLSVHEDKM